MSFQGFNFEQVDANGELSDSMADLIGFSSSNEEEEEEEEEVVEQLSRPAAKAFAQHKGGDGDDHEEEILDLGLEEGEDEIASGDENDEENDEVTEVKADVLEKPAGKQVNNEEDGESEHEEESDDEEQPKVTEVKEVAVEKPAVQQNSKEEMEESEYEWESEDGEQPQIAEPPKPAAEEKMVEERQTARSSTAPGTGRGCGRARGAVRGGAAGGSTATHTPSPLATTAVANTTPSPRGRRGGKPRTPRVGRGNKTANTTPRNNVENSITRPPSVSASTTNTTSSCSIDLNTPPSSPGTPTPSKHPKPEMNEEFFRSLAGIPNPPTIRTKPAPARKRKTPATPTTPAGEGGEKTHKKKRTHVRKPKPTPTPATEPTPSPTIVVEEKTRTPAAPSTPSKAVKRTKAKPKSGVWTRQEMMLLFCEVYPRNYVLDWEKVGRIVGREPAECQAKLPSLNAELEVFLNKGPITV
ncbi:uncharacterized protein UBRO_06683 [Ustilago bromivora]|uniref:Myb-like domain-containing protein n=1 Tax=Ustilago bromivora TaxID=307758 RepID=A0A1K0G7I9_9BASI|nr:uncharacterized protein UBRO_06683 [Ustilago bromivora]